jgi:patatin-like phospholipase/acyl hydrolase
MKRQPIPKHPLSILVWAGISKRGATPLAIFSGIMDSEFYQDKIFQDQLLPWANEVYPAGFRLYQDNDPKHTSKSTQTFMVQNDINWWRSPAESPDINPIENLWAEMKNYISSTVKPNTKAELEDGLNQFWDTVTPEKCCKYINHIHKVMPKVVQCEGGPSGY